MALPTYLDLVRRARDAAPLVPPLLLFAEVQAGDRSLLFKDLGYTFWNRELVDGLGGRLRREGVRRWVELAAGTGRLTLELVRRGLQIAATDDYSQVAERVRSYQRSIQYGSWVARLSAREAVERLQPEGVLCAWPPLGSGMVSDLLEGQVRGSSRLRMVVCIGEPGGATEAPTTGDQLAPGWRLEAWPECERWLIGFNDPPSGPAWRSSSSLLIYRA